jgi:hypothetical protein
VIDENGVRRRPGRRAGAGFDGFAHVAAQVINVL